MFELIDDVSELIYVADLETYELLYVNSAGKTLFNLSDYSGKKCYEALQGRSSPCPFCTNKILKKDNVFTWEFTNKFVNRHYLLKDKIVSIDNKDARLELAFDITDSENEKLALSNSLASEKLVMECIRLLHQSTDVKKVIPQILKMLGEFMSAERTYIFNIYGDKMFNTYEWCAENVEPQIESLQDLSTTLLGSWKPFFDTGECVVIGDLSTYKDDPYGSYEVLIKQGIKSLIAAPFEKDGKLYGYIGVDNPPTDKIRSISPLLSSLSYFLTSTIRRAENEQQLHNLSFHDTLTGFFNRNRYILDIDRLKDCEKAVGTTYIDVNGLKDINDGFGHAYGDQVLVRTANEIKKVFKNSNFYRVGGDEFVIITFDTDEARFKELVSQLTMNFDNSFSSLASIGYTWSDNASELKQMVSNADAMMYENKKKYYRNTVASNRYRHYYDDVLGLTTPGILEEMIATDKFLVYFQPKISYENRKQIGVEALVRYTKLDGTVILPGDFIHCLEETKIISKVDFFVLEYCCTKIAAWLAQGKKIVPISVNFSRYSICEKDFVERLCVICEKHNVDKKWIEIEITESVEGVDDFDISSLISRIRKAGFSVSIDDFGVQYANLSLFTNIDFDVLKIDKSLIDKIETREKARSIIAALVDVCKKTNIATIAEGVETEEQFNILKEMGFGGAQGYLFDKPLPVVEYENKYL